MCSMISSQCDKLRERATVLRQGRWSDGEDDATLMERAADTILELRDDLQLANAAVQDAEHDESMAWDRVRKVEAENKKLRELVDGLTWCCEHYSCRQECPLYDVSEPDHCREVSIKRELGIEVDG